MLVVCLVYNQILVPEIILQATQNCIQLDFRGKQSNQRPIKIVSEMINFKSNEDHLSNEELLEHDFSNIL